MRQPWTIEKYDGNIVPEGYEVSHRKPLYSAQTLGELINLDKVKNMEILKHDDHKDTHKKCGNTYHKSGPANKPNYELCTEYYGDWR